MPAFPLGECISSEKIRGRALRSIVCMMNDSLLVTRRVFVMYGLTADGIYGPKTKAKLEALLK